MSDIKRDRFGNRLYSVDEIRAMREKDEEPMRLAVEEVLLPSLEDSAAIFGRGLAAKCGAYNLYGATEAVSNILFRHLMQNSLHSVLMVRNGDVVANDSGGKVLIPARELVLEVARFTELWEDNVVVGSEQKPSMEAVAMVLWLWLAMKYQPCLLADFVATGTNNPDRLLLTVQTKQGRVSDPRQRWSRKK